MHVHKDITSMNLIDFDDDIESSTMHMMAEQGLTAGRELNKCL